MALDRYDVPDPAPGDVIDVELAVTDDVLVKAFALGPGAVLPSHEHDDATNVFHVVDGTVTVVSGDDEEAIPAPGVVLNRRGVTHGARNDTDERAVLTACLCPLPG